MTAVPLPDPWDYCYEWDGPFGTRKFSHAPWNGRAPTSSVALFTADQLRAYGDARAAEAAAQERERCATLCESTYPELVRGDLVELPCFDGGVDCAAAIRARGTPLGSVDPADFWARRNGAQK